ncbi:MAG: histidine kinase dimerization/phospho-acceptor domain-containing protein [Candidatus Omnitrophota bacterium]
MKIRSVDDGWLPKAFRPSSQSRLYSAVLFLVVYGLLYLILSVEDHLRSRMLIWHRSLSAILGATFLTLAGSTIAGVVLKFSDRYLIRPQAKRLKEENLKFRDLAVEQGRLRAISTLAAGMAHEIKNPLTSIRTFAEYLPRQYDDLHFRDRFSKIVVDEVDRVNNIVNQLLEFSRPEAPDLRVHAVDKLMDETLNLLTHNLLENRITVEKNYIPGLNLLGDKNQTLDFKQQGEKVTVSGMPEKTPGLMPVIRFECDRKPIMYLTGGMRVPKVPHPPYDPCPSDMI